MWRRQKKHMLLIFINFKQTYLITATVQSMDFFAIFDHNFCHWIDPCSNKTKTKKKLIYCIKPFAISMCTCYVCSVLKFSDKSVSRCIFKLHFFLHSNHTFPLRQNKKGIFYWQARHTDFNTPVDGLDLTFSNKHLVLLM